MADSELTDFILNEGTGRVRRNPMRSDIHLSYIDICVGSSKYDKYCSIYDHVGYS